MTDLSVMYGEGKTGKWQTPKSFFEGLNLFFGFDFDPCPPNPKFNGLEVSWRERNYVNPPYGRQIKAWIEKAFEESLKTKLVVMLIPSRTDTEWWHNLVMAHANEVWFIRGRLRFEHPSGEGGYTSAPFPSCLVIFNPWRRRASVPLVFSVSRETLEMEKLKQIIGKAPSEMKPGELSEFARSELARINSELEELKPKKRASRKAPEPSREEKLKLILDLGFTEEEANRLIDAGKV